MAIQRSKRSLIKGVLLALTLLTMCFALPTLLAMDAKQLRLSTTDTYSNLTRIFPDSSGRLLFRDSQVGPVSLRELVSGDLGDLNDVDTTDALEHQVLTYDGQEWIGSFVNRQSLNVTNEGTNGMVLSRTGSQFTWITMEGEGSGATILNELGDVSLDSPTSGQSLIFNGVSEDWENSALDLENANAITGRLPFANLAQGSGLSVLGVTGSSAANLASIVAGSDHQVLRRSGSAVGFGAVSLDQSNAVTGRLPLANLAEADGFSVLSKATTGSGTPAWLTAGANGVLRRSGSGNLAFGTIVTGNIGDAQVTFAKLQNMSGQSVLGKPNLGVGSATNITAETNHHVLRRQSDTLGFGTIAHNSADFADQNLLTTSSVLHATVEARSDLGVTDDEHSLFIAGRSSAGDVLDLGYIADGDSVTAAYLRSNASLPLHIGVGGEEDAIRVGTSGRVGINTDPSTDSNFPLRANRLELAVDGQIRFGASTDDNRAWFLRETFNDNQYVSLAIPSSNVGGFRIVSSTGVVTTIGNGNINLKNFALSGGDMTISNNGTNNHLISNVDFKSPRRMQEQELTPSGNFSIDVSNKDLFLIDPTNNVELTGTTNHAIGKEITIINMSSSKTIQVNDAGSFLISGNFTMTQNDLLRLVYNGSAWVEVTRSEN